MATTTNYGWTTPDDTGLVKDGAAAIRTLGSSIDTTTKNLNPSTTLGDIEYRSSTANTNTRLGIGSTGQVLTVAGGVPSWANAAGSGFVGCGLTKSSGQSISTSTETTLTWDTETFDTNSFHDTSTNTDRITIPAGKAGYYHVIGRITYPQNTAGARIIYLKKNTTVYVGMHSSGAANSDVSTTEISEIINLAENDYLTVTTWQASGSPLTNQHTDFQTNFQVHFLGA